jgi:hypothetical protein
MTKEEKQLRKHYRCERRRNKRHVSNSTIKRFMEEGLTFTQARSNARRGFFVEYGKERRICNYQGICDYPCNGDC